MLEQTSEYRADRGLVALLIQLSLVTEAANYN